MKYRFRTLQFRRLTLFVIASALAFAGCVADPSEVSVGNDDEENSNGDQCADDEFDCAGDGQCVDIDDDVDHCGDCAQACEPANAVGECVQGECGIASCQDSFANCDDDIESGCEIDTDNNVDHCGACGQRCEGKNAAEYSCQQGQCVAVACDDGFVDLDGEPDNGCEMACPEELENDDLPGVDNSITGCDRLREVLSTTYFVNANGGSDDGKGSMGDPFATIQHGVDAADERDNRHQVYVLSGSYAESVELPAGVRLYGGFAGREDDVWSRDIENFETTIASPTAVGIHAAGHEGGAMTGFVVSTEDADGETAMSARAVILRDVVDFELAGNILQPGDGAPGAPGDSGEEGTEGGDGERGTEGYKPSGWETCSDNANSGEVEPGLGGVGGTNLACATGGGQGGDSTLLNGGGADGEAGTDVDDLAGGSGGAAGEHANECYGFPGDLVPNDDRVGERGGGGSASIASGTPGSSPDNQRDGSVLVDSFDWVAGGGGDGERGLHGAGGGGGGAGGHQGGECEAFVASNNCETDPAGGGGGGGAGGCGGEGGQGGQGGGGSIAVLLINSQDLIIEDNSFETGAGGQGGAGGPGGEGGKGGKGASGGVGLDDAGNGGGGGDGGNGSSGGGGAGGAGGASLAVLADADTAIDFDAGANSFSLGSAGDGGDGGDSDGNDEGESGQHGGVHEFLMLD